MRLSRPPSRPPLKQGSSCKTQSLQCAPNPLASGGLAWGPSPTHRAENQVLRALRPWSGERGGREAPAEGSAERRRELLPDRRGSGGGRGGWPRLEGGGPARGGGLWRRGGRAGPFAARRGRGLGAHVTPRGWKKNRVCLRRSLIIFKYSF